MSATRTHLDRATFAVPAGNMSYMDTGTGNPIVFVHGNPSHAEEFAPAIATLSETHRCIAMDHIGFGESDKPTGWDYLPASHASNAAELLDSLDLRDVTMVVGDWGGPIGLSWALDNPDRMRGVVIANSWMWPVNRSWYYQGFSKMMGGPLGQCLTKRFNFFASQVTRQAWGSATPYTDDVRAMFTAVHTKPAERKGMWVFPREIVGSSKWLGSLWDRRRVLDDMALTLLWGMEDIAFRSDVLDTWAAEFPHAELRRLEGVGHFPALEATEQLVAAVSGITGGQDRHDQYR